VRRVKMSLAKIQEPPDKGLVLLAGVPGAGKSTFCHQVVLKSIAAERPVIFVTSERSPSEVVELLSERGMGGAVALSFVDAFTETVGLTCMPRSDTICANCADLNSLSIAVTKLQERTGPKGTLLVFDSLTSPYLFSGAEVVRFMRLFLSKFASEGNSVLALMDEGCGKEEDLAAMMSVADGILRMEIKNGSRLINVVKHPKVRPTKIEVPIEAKPTIRATMHFEPSVMRKFIRSMIGGGKVTVRREVGDFVNLFWPNLAHWSGMLWDPKRFPTMIYELNKEDGALKEGVAFFPWQDKLFIKLFMPRKLSTVRDMKKLANRWRPPKWERSGILEYLEDVSKTDEHYIRIYESSDCWGLENVGATIASHLPPMLAGVCSWDGRNWNAFETKCIGLGDSYCEWKVVPGEIAELKGSLEKDSSVVERIHERLMERLTGFLLHGKPLVERPRLGSDVHIHVACHAMGFPHLAGERYRMAQRMGGAKSGREVGKRLMEARLSEDEAIRRVIDFMNYCKVGKVTLGETIRISENCESIRTKLFMTTQEPCCFFTSGFLNGLYSAVKNRHVREIRCSAAGDPYCEWEII
jgi:predicted hydrocarbon binding protein/KaiC/GvpD/RAD55 family RecA-like ATPase